MIKKAIEKKLAGISETDRKAIPYLVLSLALIIANALMMLGF